MNTKPVLFVTLLLGFFALAAQTASAQNRSPASRTRELERRFDHLLALQEAFLPTVERLEQQVSALETRVARIPDSAPAHDARRDVAELRTRVEALEEACGRIQLWKGTSGMRQAAELRAECDILHARIRGTDGRLKSLGATDSRGGSATTAPLRSVGTSARPLDDPFGSTSDAEQEGTLRRPRITLVIEVYVDDDLGPLGRLLRP